MQLPTMLDYVYYSVYLNWLNKANEQKEVIIKEFTAKDGMKIFMLKVPKSQTKDNNEINILTEMHCYIDINDKEVEWLKEKHKVVWEG